jgi:hypothetical protein
VGRKRIKVVAEVEEGGGRVRRGIKGNRDKIEI